MLVGHATVDQFQRFVFVCKPGFENLVTYLHTQEKLENLCFVVVDAS